MTALDPAALDAMRARLAEWAENNSDTIRETSAYLIRAVPALLGEVDRLRALLSRDLPEPIHEHPEYVELSSEFDASQEQVRERQARIDAALAVCDDVDLPWSEAVTAIRAALEGTSG